ncbi:MAG: HAMP domain-containing protein [Roseiflexus sp.]|jgi:histidine kinase|nr:HAMP domain-containing protein [Roseiflexus sp.]MBO9383010.1 HAMP domain-containing protein [Roseiflexus sp.]
MSWLHQLRWKLFVSHAIIIVIAVVVLLGAAQILVRSSLMESATLASLSAGDDLLIASSEVAVQRRFQSILEQALLLASFGALAAAVVVSLFVSRRIVEPLQDLTAVSRRLAQGYYRERTFIHSDDELAELSQSINHLAEALDRTEQRRLALIADVAHELRTPLTTIEGYMEGLLDGVIAPDEQTFTLIRHEAARLRRLTEELGLLSRAEAGELRIQPRLFDLCTILQELIARFQPQFAACEVELRLHLPVQSLTVYADPDRIMQVMVNLLSNALRYTPAGGLVEVSLTPLGEYVRISVRDTGIGIEAEHLPLIFERFYRVDKSRTRNSGGTGIGLTIARHLVYASGGEIWAESDGAGKGSTFHVTLPTATVYQPVQIAVADG